MYLDSSQPRRRVRGFSQWESAVASATASAGEMAAATGGSALGSALGSVASIDWLGMLAKTALNLGTSVAQIAITQALTPQIRPAQQQGQPAQQQSQPGISFTQPSTLNPQLANPAAPSLGLPQNSLPWIVGGGIFLLATVILLKK